MQVHVYTVLSTEITSYCVQGVIRVFSISENSLRAFVDKGRSYKSSAFASIYLTRLNKSSKHRERFRARQREVEEKGIRRLQPSILHIAECRSSFLVIGSTAFTLLFLRILPERNIPRGTRDERRRRHGVAAFYIFSCISLLRCAIDSGQLGQAGTHSGSLVCRARFHPSRSFSFSFSIM